MSKLQQDTAEKTSKRFSDISLVTTVTTAAAATAEAAVQVIAPTEQTTLTEQEEEEEEEETEEDESPGTPHPEIVFDSQDIHQQLDTLTVLLQHPQQVPLQDANKSRVLLDHAEQLIRQLDPSSEENQALTSRYSQLKQTWEQLSKRLQVKQHVSTYINESKLVPMNDQNEPLHPLDGTVAMAEAFAQSLTQATEEDQAQLQHTCDLFQRGTQFGQITSAINDELDVIQQLMSNSGTSSVTDQLIQGLEQRIHMVSTTIQGVRDEYEQELLIESSDLFFTRFADRIDQLEDRYETVRDWVDQVRTK
ncbi:hypothetical protein G6F42_025374 [Rhizopus arrhizus]|nr:hypothetical protein G6F42_025374 [Rhizopus arrhizus]